jgi:ArsR family transcriptional regulator
MGKGIEMEVFFGALADRTRLRLLNVLGNQEVCVCFLVEVLKTNQPNVSRHLAYLRRAGIVAARRDGKWMHYRVVLPDHPEAVRVFQEIRSWLARDPEMQRDRRLLAKVCCGSPLPVVLRPSPKHHASVQV